MVWLIIASFSSILTSIIQANFFKPGAELNLSAISEAGSATSVAGSDLSIKVFISHVFPRNFAGSLANNEISQIVVFSIFFGFATVALKRASHSEVADCIDELAKIMPKLTELYHEFRAILGCLRRSHQHCRLKAPRCYGLRKTYRAVLIGNFRTVPFSLLGGLFLPRQFNLQTSKSHSQPMLQAFSTASSESAYPKTMETLEKFGNPKRVSSFVLSVGYSFNPDGSMMYQAFAILFIAQAYNIELSIMQQFLILLTLMVTSEGIADIARAAFVVATSSLAMFHTPEADLLLILGVEQFLDIGRTATSVVGNSVATAVTA